MRLIEWFHHPILMQLGWTLLHSLWQCAAIVGVGMFLRSLLRHRSGQTRYLMLVTVMVCSAIVPAATFLQATTAPPSRPVDVTSTHTVSPAGYDPVEIPSELVRSVAISVADEISSQDSSPDEHTGWIALVAVAWVLGVAFHLVRLGVGWRHINDHMVRNAGSLQADWKASADQLQRRISVQCRITWRQSSKVCVPFTIGMLQHIVVLPTSALTGLSTHQVKCLMLHELIHIRRRDYAVNLVQCVIETILFYHPAVWWLSRAIRQEREEICDDAVVTSMGDPQAY